MNGTRLAGLELLPGTDLPHGNFLLLIEPQRIPPHLAFISEGRYYSLSVKGVEAEKEASSVLAALDRKDKEHILIGVGSLPASRSPKELFLAYEGKEPPNSSCLSPLLDLWGFAGRGIETVHGLMAELQDQEKLEPPHRIRNSKLSEDAKEIRIPPYSGDEVNAHLQRYAKAQAKDDR